MAQWDVHPNPGSRAGDDMPHLVDLQSDLIARLSTRLVAPLMRSAVAAGGLPRRMAPRFEIAGETLTLMPQESAVIAARLLRRPVANLRTQSHRIVDALDAIVSGT
jgi:toxin CcdB